MTPFAKTGGLADVAGTLPTALGKLGIKVLILMPKYRGITLSQKKLSENVSIRFIEHEEYFNRHSLYGNERGDYPDNLERFSFFCRKALEVAKEEDFKPDIVHAHDWQTALLPVLLKTERAFDPFFKKAKSVLTVHNLAYQGHFSHRQYESLGLDPELYHVDGFEFYGKANILKAGLLFSDFITTVSPTYAKEIQTKEFGFGLEGVVKKKADRLRGILNGLDYDIWNPAKDKNIKKNYSAARPEGKAACKAHLQASTGLEVNPEIPLYAAVTRLAEQKGLDILSEACDGFLSQGTQFVLLGDGDAVYKTTFRNVANRHPGKAAVYLDFDAKKAHEIYAGADFFLMPSYFEPCGLGQMISMRYGTLPIVRRTGGLADTVTDVLDDPLGGNGFVFKEHSPSKFLKTIERAGQLFQRKKRLALFQKNAMKADFSWKKSASEYQELYKEVIG